MKYFFTLLFLILIPTTLAICGDGIREPNEACDDNNIIPNDGCSAQCNIESPKEPFPGMGINLDFHDSFSPQIIFVNGMKRAREWISDNLIEASVWNSGAPLDLRDDGYPREVPFQPTGYPVQMVKTLMFDNMQGNYPAGEYTLIFEGTGTITLSRDAQRENFQAGTHTVQVNPSNRGILLEIVESNPNDPIHNIRFILPGHSNTYESQPLYPLFRDAMQPFKVMRVMNILNTNGNPCSNHAQPEDLECIHTWEARPKQNYYTQNLKGGMAWEEVILIANELNIDLWISVPHAADDNYFRNLAQLLNNQLNSNINIYLELSNELWNYAGPFSQTRHFLAKGRELNLDSDGNLARIKYKVLRSSSLFQIFEDEFNNPQRIIKVIAGQATNSWLNRQIMQATTDTNLNPTAISPDAFAIAPYFGHGYGAELIESNAFPGISINEVIDQLEAQTIPQLEEDLIENKQIADEFQVELIAYEGGQHLTPGLYRNNQALVTFLHEVNRHPRMYDLYTQYYNLWFNAGTDLFTAFQLTSVYSDSGAWGHLESLNQPLAQAHKQRATLDYINQFNEECSEFDTNCNGQVDLSDVLNIIAAWKGGNRELIEVLQAVTLWKQG